MYRLIVIAIAIVALAIPAFAAPVEPDAGKIEQVRVGVIEQANAIWWGFDPQDSTDQLQAAIDSGASKLIVPFMGEPWVVRQLNLASNQEIILEPGVVILAKQGALKGKWDSFIRIHHVENVTVRGYGATIQMRRDDYQSDAYEKSEWRHGFNILSSRNLQLIGFTVRESGGDGIQLGCFKSEDDMPYSENVVIRDVVSDSNHRQGLSVISARNLLVERCVFSNTDGTPPMAGIDLEPNRADEYLENITIRNCIIDNNGGGGITAYLRPLDRTSASVSVLIENVHVRSGQGYGFGVARSRDEGPQGTITFRNCVVENTQKPGAFIRAKSANGVDVRFENCAWHNAGLMSGEAAEKLGYPVVPILIFGQKSNEFAVQTIGGVTFENCRVFDDGDRPAVVLYDERTNSQDITTIAGDIVVHHPHRDDESLYETPVATGLRVTHASQGANHGAAPMDQ